jgi:hypothetical protein
MGHSAVKLRRTDCSRLGFGYNSTGPVAAGMRGLAMKFIYPLVGCLSLALTAGANAASLTDDFWLLGNYTQNVPCKGDGSDPAEVRVKISTQEIDSKVGVCTFLDTKADGNSVTAHVECQFPAGPLEGDITFTQKPDHTVAFVDDNKLYNAVLYRCPKKPD